MNLVDQTLLFAISLTANIFSAFSGGGAGLIQFPVLIFFGLSFSVALATHKIASVALGIGATLRHWRASHLQRHLSLLILAAGLPGVLIGALVVLHIPDRIAQITLGMLTLGLGIFSFMQPNLGQQLGQKHRDKYGMWFGSIVIFFLGILNGSLTSGTGLFVTMWLVHWFGLDYKLAVAHTLILVGLFWNGTGAIVLGVLAEVRWDWLPVLVLGSVLGGYIGAHLAILKGNRWIKRSYELVAVLIGLKLILS